MTDPNFLAPAWETPPEMPIKGARLGGGSDIPVGEALAEALALDQRGTSST